MTRAANSVIDPGISISLPPELHPFVTAALHDPEIQSLLAGIAEVDAFVSAAAQIAAMRGIPLPTDILRQVLRPDPLGLGRWMAAPVTLNRWPGAGWIPARSVPGQSDELEFEWFNFGDRPTCEPFFEDSVRRAGSLPFNWLFRSRTSLDTLIAGHCEADCPQPSGLIFHMSRCGSTMLARMLMSVEHHAVASEPEPFDAVLQWAQTSSASAARKIAAMRSIAAALGRRHSPAPDRFFMKMDAWHTPSLPLIRAAFPDVPWVFLYRDPVEVLVSQQVSPGLHIVPGMLPDSLTGITDGANMAQQEFGAEILARICEAVVGNWHLGGGMVVNYRDLLVLAQLEIPKHFGFVPNVGERAAFADTMLADAKQPTQDFIPDTALKQAEASQEMRNLASRRIGPVYRQLDRLGQPAVATSRISDSHQNAG
jgi:hypothetical protein